MKHDVAFYEKLLFGYLPIYGILHIAIIIFLIAYNSEWWTFIYFMIFWLHLPIFLPAVALSFLARKLKNSLIWGLDFLLYLLSNSYWITIRLRSGHWLPYKSIHSPDSHTCNCDLCPSYFDKKTEILMLESLALCQL